jgi:hypothetical protein
VSINLQNDGIAAIRDLRNHSAWPSFLESILDFAQVSATRALDAESANVSRACGYAACARDFYIALESAATGKPQNQVKKPGASKE